MNADCLFPRILAALFLLCISLLNETGCLASKTSVQQHSLLKNAITLIDENTIYLDVSENSTLVETLQISFKDFEKLMEILMHDLLQSVPMISESTEKMLTELSHRIVDCLETLSIKVLNFGNDQARTMVLSIRDKFIQLSNDLQGMTSHIDDGLVHGVKYLNESLMNNSKSIDMWAFNIKKELRSVNDLGFYKEGCQIVDEYILRSTNKLRSCCNIAIKPMSSLCGRIGAVIAEALRVLADAMDRMQDCLENKNSYLEYLLPCFNLAYDDVSSLALEAAQLRHKINSILPMKILYSRFCISFVLVEIQQGQIDVEKDLNHKSNIHF